MSRCQDVKMSRCQDVRMSGCWDVGMSIELMDFLNNADGRTWVGVEMLSHLKRNITNIVYIIHWQTENKKQHSVWNKITIK